MHKAIRISILIGVLITALVVPQFTKADVDMKDCQSCHSQKIMRKPVKHDGAVYGCEMCHFDHESQLGSAPELPNLPYRLRDAVSGLCFQCHSENESVKGCFGEKTGTYDCNHPVGRHPVQGFEDPLYPEKEFNCISCHNPHSSDMPNLFRYNYGPKTPYQGHRCAVCHWENYFGSGRQPPTPAWD